MSTYSEIQKINPNYLIHSLEDFEFSNYGVVYYHYNIDELKTYLSNHVTIPALGEENIYIPSNPKIEKLSVVQEISRDVFAGIPTEAGECSGHADALTAVEFHQGSEVNVFVTDVIMVLGKRGQLKDQKFNAEKDAKLFFVPSGSVIEFFSDTLHYSPCEVHSTGFKFIVILIKGSNQKLPNNFKTTNKMITKTNKFQLAHHVRTDKIQQGVLEGVIGKLVKLQHID